MKKFIYSMMAGGWLLAACLATVSCSKYEYTDALQGLGKRVEVLEQKTLSANTLIENLRQIVAIVEQQGYVRSVATNVDGTYTITFSDGKSVTLRDGRVGTDGEEAALQISAEKGPDGIYYWTLNGSWLLDENGQKIQAGARDGKDGKDGKSTSEQSLSVPQVRINPDTRLWEISTDGGKTWNDTGVAADGKDGKNGTDDFFMNVKVSEDGKSVSFILNDGRTFTVPLLQEE